MKMPMFTTSGWIYWLLLYVSLSLHKLATNAEEDCGTLEVSYTCHMGELDAVLRLDPSQKMRICLQGNRPRWFHYVNTSWTQVYPEAHTEHVLTIHNLTALNNGVYAMDCSNTQSFICNSEVRVDIPTDIECDQQLTTPTIPNQGKTQGDGDIALTSSVIVVISVCSMIIVVVIAGTVLILLRKRTSPSVDTMRLTSVDRGSILDLQDDAGSIVNEIDQASGACKGDNSGFNSSKLSLLTLQVSPGLPKRPLQKRPITDSENDYAIIRDSMVKGSRIKTFNKGDERTNDNMTENDYAIIRDSMVKGSKIKRFNKGDERTNDNMTENDYAIIRDSMVKSSSIKVLHKDDTIINNNMTEKNRMATAKCCDDGYAKIAVKKRQPKDSKCTDTNITNVPEYAKVLKHKVKAEIDHAPMGDKDLKQHTRSVNGISPEYAVVEKNKNKIDNENSPTDSDVVDKRMNEQQHSGTENATIVKSKTQKETQNQPHHATVVTSKFETDIKKTDETSKKNNVSIENFNVVFPYIDCNEIARSLDENEYENNVSEEAHAYGNIATKRRHSKVRVSRKELQYAVLDLSSSSESLDKLGYGPYDLPEFVAVSDSIPYASIDFDKKAFVAPIRKAPSSWYKRRNIKEAKGNDKRHKENVNS